LLGQLAALLARELAPNWRKFRTAFRITMIATIGSGLVEICHLQTLSISSGSVKRGPPVR
jgi:hypothetical protein